MKLSWFFGFFLVSGFCSLVYEVVWLRLAMASFGVTTALVSIVLSVFMAGLALGSWLVGRLAPRFEAKPPASPLRFYALTELFIAVLGMAVPRGLEWGRIVLEQVGSGVSWGSSSYYLASGTWIALTLLPICTCMGATFPLAMSAIRKSLSAEAERSFSYLYSANVLGAISGTVVSAFFMVELLGFQGTLRVTAALNAILFASAFIASFAEDRSGAPRAKDPAGGSSEALLRSHGKGILWLLFTTGLASMAMEVVWIRQFTPYLGTVVYTFAAILALYLTATFLGCMAYRLWARSHEPAEESTAWTVAWMAVGLFCLIPLVSADPRLPLTARQLHGAFRVALGIMPFCAVVGFLTPMLVDRWSRGDPNYAGTAYAINVVGSILGPLLAGFVLLPWLGERWALLTLAAPLFAIGGLASLRQRPVTAAALPFGRSPRALFGVMAALSLSMTALTEDFESIFPRRVVRRDHTATVVATGEGMQKQMLVNGVGMTSLTPITKMMSHLPLAFLSDPPQSSLVVCFGMGTSFRSLLSWGIRATAVELVPSVPSLFGYYHGDGAKLLYSPLARIVIDDGRRFLERSRETYDVITVDPPPPVSAAGSSLLYSREFYAVVKKRLRPGGILQQWLPRWVEPIVLSSVARALGDSFPYVRVFNSFTGDGFHFLASMSPILATPASVLAGRLPPGAVADLLEWGPASTAMEQFQAVVSREIPLARVIAAAPGAPVLQDDRPVNEYFLIRVTFRAART